MGTARVAIALVVCLLRQATALSVATAASPLQAIQSLDAHLQSQLARYGSLAAAGAAAEGVGVWRGCFLKGRVPDDAFDGAAWPSDAGARSRCQRAFAPVARRGPAALLGTAASSGAGRFQRRAAAFEAMRRCADRVGDVEELAPLLASLGRRATAASGASRRERRARGARAARARGPRARARAARRRLDFLERGFGGGTDVISPLRRAVALLRARPAFADADVLLVSDGELMDPPVDAATAADLDALRRSRGLRVAGSSWAGAAARRRTRRRGPSTRSATASTFLADHDDLALLMGADDDDDDALYDRFLIRREVAPVSDAAVADLLLGDDVDGACPRAFLAPLLAVPKPPRAALRGARALAAGRAAALERLADRARAVAEGRELPDDDDEFAAAPRAAPAPAPGDDDDFDLTMSRRRRRRSSRPRSSEMDRGARGPEG
ncbi:hypothetical protein JL722_7932 [Aureococcus anophagefferens]|nr:hypothetical protein JL722_7932 [Aureococcus anophagefferens]